MENVDKVNKSPDNGYQWKIRGYTSEYKRLMERSNQEYLELMLTNIKKDFTHTLTAYIKDDTASSLERG